MKRLEIFAKTLDKRSIRRNDLTSEIPEDNLSTESKAIGIGKCEITHHMRITFQRWAHTTRTPLPKKCALKICNRGKSRNY